MIPYTGSNAALIIYSSTDMHDIVLCSTRSYIVEACLQYMSTLRTRNTIGLCANQNACFSTSQGNCMAIIIPQGLWEIPPIARWSTEQCYEATTAHGMPCHAMPLHPILHSIWSACVTCIREVHTNYCGACELLRSKNSSTWEGGGKGGGGLLPACSLIWVWYKNTLHIPVDSENVFSEHV